ncbi:hypothetical protein EI94DRAFT_1799572 [Lactarius quietus]|nr:hypothetical protein EI94DRAFT_1799572 [Lactarius quietus]
MPPKPKPPTLPSTTQQLAEVFLSATKGIENILSLNLEPEEPIQQMIVTFLANSTIAKIHRAAQTPTPYASTPSSLLEDVKSIKSTLAALQKVIFSGTQASKPSQGKTLDNAPSAPPPRAKGKTQALSFANAAASPPCPSIVALEDSSID